MALQQNLIGEQDAFYAVDPFNPQNIDPRSMAPSRIKPALAGYDITASGDHRLGRFGVKV